MFTKFHKISFAVFIVVLILLGISLRDNFQGFSVGITAGENLSTELVQSPIIKPLELKVNFLDVGQGDAIYIRTPQEQDILIDGGPDDKVLESLGQVMPFWDREIDVVILSHPHADHVAGLVQILKRYTVKKIYLTGVLHTAPDYLAFLEEIKKQKIPTENIKELMTLDFGNEVELNFIYPDRSLFNEKIDNLNNSSIVARLRYKNKSFLFTGDAESPVEKELLTKKRELNADVLKIGHHGSTTSSSEDFLKAVNPKFAVIGVGRNNSFGHPSLKTLSRLERFNIPFFRTDLLGTITFLSDGENVWQK
jgi:competence protein ComEC